MPVTSGLYYYVSEREGAKSLQVVLIHGAGGNHLSWPVEIRRLPGYRVYALDLPGHGKSAGQGLQSIGAYARSVLDWLQAMGLPQAVFIGHSMGGAIALHLGIYHFETVIGLGVISAGTRLGIPPDVLVDTANPTTFLKAVKYLVEASFSSVTNPRLVDMAATRLAKTRHSVLHGDLLACEAFDVTGRVKEICQPIQLICGVDDRMSPLRLSQSLLAEKPEAYLEIVPQAGHMVMLEQPAVVASCLTRFLAVLSHQPGGGS